MNKDQLNKITGYLVDNVWRNENVMFDKEFIEEHDVENLVDIISSLHNLLCEQVTGERYNYAFHWANKVGSDVDDKMFDDLLKDEEKKDEEIKVSKESGRIELSISEYASQSDGEAAIDAFVNAIDSMLGD